MRLIVISGRSGSGKTTALRALEDAGYNCIDNFPVVLLQSLVHDALRDPDQQNANIAVCIDARSRSLARFPEILLSLDRMDVDCQVIYLDAASATLVQRFSETRRRHPLTNRHTDLLQAIEAERDLLEGIADLADLNIDTTLLRGRALAELVKDRVIGEVRNGLSLLFRSFGFKFGVPVDADLVFDLRCLPNPYWIPELNPLTGLDAPVARFFEQSPDVGAMFDDIAGFLERWLPRFENDQRTYLTVALGCTGGQHRSVYMAERLRARFDGRFAGVLVRHRELDA
ncbi:MAG: RNase adapter RapZ [Pseudomonadales bacterium]|nr:RNase adapter RapZ [Pseudomonadales bacterium]